MGGEFGIEFDLRDDAGILRINSPQGSVEGPFAIVYKDMAERWVVVALSVDGTPRLGIRRFDGKGGTPFSREPVWFYIPFGLELATLQQMPISIAYRKAVQGFLAGDISGQTLRERRANHV